MASVERTISLAPPTDEAGVIDYSKHTGLDRYRQGPDNIGLDSVTIGLAVAPINSSAETAPIIQFHGALAVHEVATAYVREFGASPSTINRPPEPEMVIEPTVQRGLTDIVRNAWSYIRPRRTRSRG